jgi:predicted nucleotidyltransferase
MDQGGMPVNTSNSREHHPINPPILPAGTAVVTLVETRGSDGRPLHPRGTAAVIVTSPVDAEHAYRVKFPGGDECSLGRREIQTLSHFQQHGALVDPLTEYDLYGHVIYRCVIGSRAYGLDRDGSDTDRRGIYLAPASMHWSVYGVPEQLERHDTQECYWELEKFIKLALKANPNVLEALYSPIVEHIDGIAVELRERRCVFLSRLVYQTFNGYAMSQFRKIEQDVRSRGEVKWKHAMHLIRLLRSGIGALVTGELPVRVGGERDELLAIRDGLLAWEEVDSLRRSLHAEFERAFERSSLPDRPDYESANAMLVRARAAAARKEFPT